MHFANNGADTKTPKDATAAAANQHAAPESGTIINNKDDFRIRFSMAREWCCFGLLAPLLIRKIKYFYQVGKNIFENSVKHFTSNPMLCSISLDANSTEFFFLIKKI